MFGSKQAVARITQYSFLFCSKADYVCERMSAQHKRNEQALWSHLTSRLYRHAQPCIFMSLNVPRLLTKPWCLRTGTNLTKNVKVYLVKWRTRWNSEFPVEKECLLGSTMNYISKLIKPQDIPDLHQHRLNPMTFLGMKMKTLPGHIGQTAHAQHLAVSLINYSVWKEIKIKMYYSGKRL